MQALLKEERRVRSPTDPDTRAAAQTQIARREYANKASFVYMDETHLSAARAQLISVSLEHGLRSIEQR
jgi:hypothetical protein